MSEVDKAFKYNFTNYNIGYIYAAHENGNRRSYNKELSSHAYFIHCIFIQYSDISSVYI